jgi:hypothetical protein
MAFSRQQDCCHSATILNLPYTFKANGEYDQMHIHREFDFKKFFSRFDHEADIFWGDDDEEE